MKYCKDLNFTQTWVNQGLNPCFIDTVTSGILFLHILLFGCIQCSLYRKYATKLPEKNLPGSCGFTLQVMLSFILMLEAVIHTILCDTSIRDQTVAGYQVFTAIALVYCWIASIRLLFYERRQMLPSIPTRGHGLILLVFWSLVFIKENLSFISWESSNYWWSLKGYSDHIELGLWIVRYSCSLMLLILGFLAPGLNRNLYHLLTDVENGPTPEVAQNQSTWKNVWSKLKVMIPFVWPKGSYWRQGLVLVCLLLLGAGRGINVLVPLYSKYIINSLTVQPNTLGDDLAELKVTRPEFRYDYILIYCLLIFLKGGGTGTTGFLNNARSFLWIPVQQYTTRRIQVRLFNHLHRLSLRWHLQRKTGEVLRVMDRGTNSINNLLSYVVFQILPTIVDIIIAIVYFVTVFNYIFGLVVFLCMVLYLAVTIWITEWRTKYRREMNKLDNEKNSKAVDSLLNFETVKYYGASEFETNRFDTAIKDYQIAEWKSTASLNLLNSLQNTVITFGTISGSLLCAYAVVYSISDLHLTVGDYVLFGTYLSQLYGPLNWLGTYYRMIQQSFIDMENMFELLDESQEIKDIPDAKNIAVTNGKIEFRNVNFHYEESKKILKDVSFVVPAGQTFALVGHSGSGKSTIIRLLFRFYDVISGKILIDGQDISLVKQESLRQQIGVVPQDTVLFNADIRYNIRYGNVDANDKQVEEAADNADIHERILSFPDGYNTVVGERGLKLSGGEKQRVAIARTILKNPQIVLLDEATSALDTKTERNIQTSLERVCENRTTIIVAHRLSTIIHAHQILVMKEGVIVERGTHDELLQVNGFYADMWHQQLTKKEEAGDDKHNGNGTVSSGSINNDADAS
ncbi:ATP-binding cassette sub-family B member 6-like [Saccostrea echinata]|uniref:ATP-binding cassette sub-family B member 6-like n=1 Tax=Saccostrea echinata TaxID=191078 RepID=UPI002A80F502|nr:ATP-binding cassette sub-family B member 6-like [Saccostrea echinata]